MNAHGRGVIGTVLLAGLIAGTIDIGAASVISGLSPLVILRAIASGVLGSARFGGDVAIALLGLLLQWSMAILITMIYLIVTNPLPALRRRWRLTGVFAGVVIFLVMNYIVVPLSAAPFRPRMTIEGLRAAFTPYQFVANLLAMILFGLIIGYFLRGVSPRGASKPQIAQADSKLS